MSEEKPTFKITDRRLFNIDGTPREDIPAEETNAATPAASAAETTGRAAGSAAEETAQAASGASTGGGRGAQASAAMDERDAASSSPAEPEVDDMDAQEFLMVVEFIASFAADALGMVNHPGMGARDVNLPLAKQCIDMLSTLQKKTRGNLGPQERQFLEMILAQLRMQYVSLSGAPRGPQGGGSHGFRGSDITGGR